MKDGGFYRRVAVEYYSKRRVLPLSSQDNTRDVITIYVSLTLQIYKMIILEMSSPIPTANKTCMPPTTKRFQDLTT